VPECVSMPEAREDASLSDLSSACSSQFGHEKQSTNKNKQKVPTKNLRM